ncbi:MAG: sugar-binding domain-containing protein, partial [Bacteroidota bacterium]
MAFLDSEHIVVKACVLAFFLLPSGVLPSSPPQVNDTIDLNGTWMRQWAFVREMPAEPVDTIPWEAVHVPQWHQADNDFGKLGENHFAWYRRSVFIPASWRGKRIKLAFEAVAFETNVYVNQEKVGEHLDGYTPFDCDATEHINYGANNDILVCVGDRISIQMPGKKYFEEQTSAIRGKRSNLPPYRSILAPVDYPDSDKGGIWAPVSILAKPDLHVRRTTIRTSTRKKEFWNRVFVKNESDRDRTVDIHASIRQAGETVLALPKRQVSIAANTEVELLFESRWDNPSYWWPHDPQLYQSVIEITEEGKLVEHHKTRFGFREFWIEGSEFQLNGVRFPVRRASLSASFQDGQPHQVRSFFLKCKANHTTIVRTHSVLPAWAMAIADEVGMPIMP